MGKRPLDILNETLNSNVFVRLKKQREFRGQLQGYDMHMNLVLDNAEEILNEGKSDQEIERFEQLYDTKLQA
ncbi:small nuclear ribonucleoprotein [Methanosarcinales archaeon ex4572_44]|nr:MAG: small nuclear ribonucleoprotein [Methanosarcinales archaeon ex4572_44]